MIYIIKEHSLIDVTNGSKKEEDRKNTCLMDVKCIIKFCINTLTYNLKKKHLLSLFMA